jgi:hypothetical protein
MKTQGKKLHKQPTMTSMNRNVQHLSLDTASKHK